jgi:hypothetical protein
LGVVRANRPQTVVLDGETYAFGTNESCDGLVVNINGEGGVDLRPGTGVVGLGAGRKGAPKLRAVVEADGNLWLENRTSSDAHVPGAKLMMLADQVPGIESAELKAGATYRVAVPAMTEYESLGPDYLRVANHVPFVTRITLAGDMYEIASEGRRRSQLTLKIDPSPPFVSDAETRNELGRFFLLGGPGWGSWAATDIWRKNMWPQIPEGDDVEDAIGWKEDSQRVAPDFVSTQLPIGAHRRADYLEIDESFDVVGLPVLQVRVEGDSFLVRTGIDAQIEIREGERGLEMTTAPPSGPKWYLPDLPE